MECNFRNIVDGKYRNLQCCSTHFCAISNRFRDINIFHIFYLQNVSQGHGLQFYQ